MRVWKKSYIMSQVNFVWRLKMNSKDKMNAIFNGTKLDHFPVVVPYTDLLHRDRWEQITKQPSWTYFEWLKMEPKEHCKEYERFLEILPFDWITPWWANSREEREAMEIIKNENGTYQVKENGIVSEIPEDLHHLTPPPREERTVYTRKDVDEKVEVVSAETLVSRGHLDYIEEAVKSIGDRCFITAVVSDTFAECYEYVGISNLFTLLYEEPELIHYLSEKLLAKVTEEIRALGKAGVDAIFVEECLNTSDMLSPAFFLKFAMPYTRQIVTEVQSQNMKVILAYFGGVADRVEEINSLGADGLLVETSMKNYVNDLSEIGGKLSGNTCLFGNIDPYGILEKSSDEVLKQKIEEQAEVGRKVMNGRFITSTGSPVTPKTSIERLRTYIDLARQTS
jgi:uroporphyrinogen-III decarboxylase